MVHLSKDPPSPPWWCKSPHWTKPFPADGCYKHEPPKAGKKKAHWQCGGRSDCSHIHTTLGGKGAVLEVYNANPFVRWMDREGYKLPKDGETPQDANPGKACE